MSQQPLRSSRNSSSLSLWGFLSNQEEIRKTKEKEKRRGRGDVRTVGLLAVRDFRSGPFSSVNSVFGLVHEVAVKWGVKRGQMSEVSFLSEYERLSLVTRRYSTE